MQQFIITHYTHTQSHTHTHTPTHTEQTKYSFDISMWSNSVNELLSQFNSDVYYDDSSWTIYPIYLPVLIK